MMQRPTLFSLSFESGHFNQPLIIVKRSAPREHCRAVPITDRVARRGRVNAN